MNSKLASLPYFSSAMNITWEETRGRARCGGHLVEPSPRCLRSGNPGSDRLDPSSLYSTADEATRAIQHHPGNSPSKKSSTATTTSRLHGTRIDSMHVGSTHRRRGETSGRCPCSAHQSAIGCSTSLWSLRRSDSLAETRPSLSGRCSSTTRPRSCPRSSPGSASPPLSWTTRWAPSNPATPQSIAIPRFRQESFEPGRMCGLFLADERR